jgi:tetratricopeptide (TPR) repeat protein
MSICHKNFAGFCYLDEMRRFFLAIPLLFTACGGDQPAPPKAAIQQLNLKKGAVIVCGTPDKEFGVVQFDIPGSQQVKIDFNTAVELLHSFEYAEAEKVFAKIIDEAPGTVMAYWGIAMCSYHPLWEPPTESDCKKGTKALEIGYSIHRRSGQETAWLDAVAAYYKDWNTTDAHSRAVHFEKAMEQLHASRPTDKEAAIFYALALDASALPTDATYTHQKKAGQLLDSIYAKTPNHPGIIHYIIHTYDYPGIAQLGLAAARRYAEVAPSSAHALHMPSHIFTRLGLWNDCIISNTRSVEAAQCYAQSAGVKGHWDEELHGLDYLVYAYLQKGDNAAAEKQLSYLATIKEVWPVNFKEAYTFAASPCREALENKDWTAATRLSPQPASFPWNKFPWQEAIIHFGRLLGFVHLNKIPAAQAELATLDSLRLGLVKQNDAYKARQVEIQIAAGRAWIAHAKGADTQALAFMKQAADWEDSTSKHPVTPGEVLPARELYADLLNEHRQYDEAFRQYEAVLKRSPNRFNSLYGAGWTTELTKDSSKARLYYQQLVAIADPHSTRKELKHAQIFLHK